MAAAVPDVAGTAARSRNRVRRRDQGPRRRRPMWHTSAGAGTGRTSRGRECPEPGEIGRLLAENRLRQCQHDQHAKVPSASARGGKTSARLMRWTWNHRPKISSSGTPIWTNTKSENSRSLTAAALEEIARQRRREDRQAVEPFRRRDGRELRQLVPFQPEADDAAKYRRTTAAARR